MRFERPLKLPFLARFMGFATKKAEFWPFWRRTLETIAPMRPSRPQMQMKLTEICNKVMSCSKFQILRSRHTNCHWSVSAAFLIRNHRTVLGIMSVFSCVFNWYKYSKSRTEKKQQRAHYYWEEENTSNRRPRCASPAPLQVTKSWVAREGPRLSCCCCCPALKAPFYTETLLQLRSNAQFLSVLCSMVLDVSTI